MLKHSRGFTLIEMMIAVIIIGILSSIAIPSYQAYLRTTACEDAKATLIGAASLMERHRAQTNSYTGAALGNYAASPVDGAAKNTNIAITASDATSYTLTASATETGRLKDKGTLTLNSVGARGGSGALAGTWGSCSGI